MFRTIARYAYEFAFWAASAVGAYWLYMHGAYHRFMALDAMETIGPFAYILFIVICAAAFFFLLWLKEAIASSVMSVFMTVSSRGVIDFEKGNYADKLYRSALKLEKRGEFVAAAEAYESAELWREAIAAYEKAGELSRAAEVAEKIGENVRAIELYESGQNYEMAAARAAAEGLRERAGRLYHSAAEKAQEQNSFRKAAGLFEKANDYERAGKLYETLRQEQEALRCYERAGAADKVEQILKRIGNSQGGSGQGAAADLVLRSSEMLAKQGKFREAAEALENAGEFIRAGEMYEKAGEWERAGEVFFRAERIPQAEACYRKSSDKTKTADFLARTAQHRGDWKAAGGYFLEAQKPNQAIDAYKKAKDFLSAAHVYEDLKRYLMAAEMYSSAHEFRAAGEAFAKGHDWRNAAECFENCGELTQAMEAYATAGNFFRAGVLALRSGDSAQAIDYLQRVLPTSADWKLATGYLATAFFNQNRINMAQELFEKVADQIVPSAETASIFYAYARLLEKEDPEQSLVMYRRILSVSVSYGDVGERVGHLEKMLTEQASSGGRTSQPDPIAEDEEQEDEPLVQPNSRQQVQAQPKPTASDSDSIFVSPTVATRQATQGPKSSRQDTQAPETRFGEEGRYTILNELGRGACAIVYKAFDEHLAREVALKTFSLSRNAGPGKEDIFLHHARLLARLTHPNIVTVYDCGHMNYLYYIAMEYVPGENLRQLIKRRGPLSLDELRQMFTQVASAVEYAHGQDILHLDMKPSNVLLRTTGDVKVVDFGVSKLLLEAATGMNDDGNSQFTIVNTPQYMAPEQITGNAADVRTDIYALGLTLFFLLTGRTPFEAKKVADPAEITRMQLHSSFPLPSMLRATLPSKLDMIFVRCTQKNPADRYTAIEEMMKDLERV